MQTFHAGVEQAARRCVEVLTALSSGDDAEVARVLERYGENAHALSNAELASLHRAARSLEPVTRATDAQSAARALNDVLAHCTAPRLTAHDDTEWHLHVDSADDADWGEWFAASSAFALATILAETQRAPLGTCAASGCDNPFLTYRPGRPRRFCSATCATRTRVADHRARQ